MTNVPEMTTEEAERVLLGTMARERIKINLSAIKLKLVIPYLRNCEEAKVMNWNVTSYGALDIKHPTPFDDDVFPGTKNLIKWFDSTRIAILERYSGDDEFIRRQKELEETFDHDIVFYANWRGDCVRYLTAIARNTDKAASMVNMDETPMKLVSAVMSLSSVYYGYMPEEILQATSEIIAAWRYLHN